jgi:hypothetical protein
MLATKNKHALSMVRFGELCKKRSIFERNSTPSDLSLDRIAETDAISFVRRLWEISVYRLHLAHDVHEACVD